MTVEPLEFDIIHMPVGEKKLLFIHGYGGNIEQPGVRWMMNRFNEAGHSVTYLQLPTVINSFKKDILEPVRKVQEGLGEHVIAGFSIGGLAATYLEGSLRTIYLSPFWGISDRWRFKGMGPLLKSLAWANVPPLKRHFEKEDAGPMAVDDDMIGIPDFTSPRTVHELHHAQIHMPTPRAKDVIFYCRKDRVISIDAVERMDVEKHTFNGGHMFYLSRERKLIMDMIISRIDEGFN